eukprot:GILJ01007094.1.p1 GENE.GILJ01007094.1~~GILJ01007094.1.p1  ORF type:complete len:388 (+),score=40.74 GILJ01007094.1:75-1238(+)
MVKHDTGEAGSPVHEMKYYRYPDDEPGSPGTPPNRRHSDHVILPLQQVKPERLRSKGEVRKRTRKAQRQNTPKGGGRRGRIAAYCTCDEYNLENLYRFSQRLKPVLYGDVLHIHVDLPPGVVSQGRRSIFESLRPSSFDGEYPLQHIFIFACGCVVFWGLQELQENIILGELKQFEDRSLSDGQIERDDFQFVEPRMMEDEETDVGDTLPSHNIKNDHIFLATYSVTERLAVSFGFAQSVKLAVFEEDIQQTIETTRSLPAELAQVGKINLTREECSKKIGELFIKRNSINLDSDLIDTPDFFWDDDEFQHLYDKVCRYLEIGNRAEVLNKRLDIIKELLEMLNSELTSRDSTRVEWIIIWLIVVEVAVLLVWQIFIKDILGYFPSR